MKYTRIWRRTPLNSGRYPGISVRELQMQLLRAEKALSNKHNEEEYISEREVFNILRDILPDYFYMEGSYDPDSKEE